MDRNIRMWFYIVYIERCVCVFICLFVCLFIMISNVDAIKDDK